MTFLIVCGVLTALGLIRADLSRDVKVLGAIMPALEFSPIDHVALRQGTSRGNIVLPCSRPGAPPIRSSALPQIPAEPERPLECDAHHTLGLLLTSIFALSRRRLRLGR